MVERITEKGIILPVGVEDKRKPNDEVCPKCGADKSDFKGALGGVVYCMKCGTEVNFNG